MNKIKDLIYNMHDILVAMLILAVAAIKSRRKEAEAALIEQGPDEKGGGA